MEVGATEAKEKEVSVYTSVFYFSKEKERKLSADWNPSSSLLVIYGTQSFTLQEPKSQSCCCRNGAGSCLLTEVWDMDKFRQPSHSPAHKTLSWSPWQCLPHKMTALMQWLQHSCGTLGCDFLHTPATLLTAEFVRAKQYIWNQTQQPASTPYWKWCNNRA